MPEAGGLLDQSERMVQAFMIFEKELEDKQSEK